MGTNFAATGRPGGVGHRMEDQNFHDKEKPFSNALDDRMVECDEAEEGELPAQASPYPAVGDHQHHRSATRGGNSDQRRTWARSRSPDARRSISDKGHGRDYRRGRSRSHSRDRRRRNGDRREERRRRYRSRSRDRSRDRSKGRGDRRSKEEEAQKRVEEEEENEEEYQERVAAALQAQDDDDEEKLIQERRRRRMEILAKHKMHQPRDHPTAPSTAEISTKDVTEPSQPPAAEHTEEDDEVAVMVELGGAGDNGAVDIWRHDAKPGGGTAGVNIVTSVSVPASGIGEAHDVELERRLHAAEVARGMVPPQPATTEDDLEDDMFAATPEDAQRTTEKQSKTRTAMVAGTAVSHGRGLVDSYDDAEGYYNFQVGEVIANRFEVVQAHGRGVFSSVLRARDLAAQDLAAGPAPEVAVKVIRANETMYKAGQMEKVILHKLAQADPDGRRHCIRLLGSFEYRNHLCLVFEAMDMDLRGLTKRYGRGIGLSLSAVRIYAQQMLVALQHLRNCGILHADIKPDNILVNERRTVVKLCDFGSAMFSGDNEITPYLVSRFYRSPEVILGLPYDHPMDMWSVGCVVYELFTGQILFPGKTNNSMLRYMMDAKGPFPKKMLKKAEFAFKHFESDPNMTFSLLEEDTVTGRPVRRLIPNPSVKKDFAALLAGQAPDRRKLAQLADLLERMMALDPEKRITPKEALAHPFIKEVPAAPRSMGGSCPASKK